MTWKQFKEEVDRQLADKGISEDEEIWHIDFSGQEDLSIGLDRTGLFIS